MALTLRRDKGSDLTPAEVDDNFIFLKAGGADKQVQFNDNGVLGGNATFTFDKSTGYVSIGPGESGYDAYVQGWAGTAPFYVTNQSDTELVSGIFTKYNTNTDKGPLALFAISSGANPAAFEADAIATIASPSVTAVTAYVDAHGVAVTDARGLYIFPVAATAGGSVTNGYGIVVADQSHAANNWAIKTGSGKVEFGDFVTIRRNSAPADDALSAGEMSMWFDDTNGSAKFMVKAKQADGTVKTGSFNVQT